MIIGNLQNLRTMGGGNGSYAELQIRTGCGRGVETLSDFQLNCAGIPSSKEVLGSTCPRNLLQNPPSVTQRLGSTAYY